MFFISGSVVVRWLSEPFPEFSLICKHDSALNSKMLHGKEKKISIVQLQFSFFDYNTIWHFNSTYNLLPVIIIMHKPKRRHYYSQVEN